MNKFLTNKTVLFIAPIFYGYEKVIARQMQAEGASVIFYPEREDGIKYKFINNFKKNDLARFQESYYSAILDQVKNKKIDYLFVIRGFFMPVSFIEKMRSTFPNAILIMHQWDSMRNNNYSNSISHFDKVFSFDPLDCAGITALKYLPNFYLPEYVLMNKIKIKYDISFVGWAYEDRLKILKDIAVQLNGRVLFKYCYIPRLSYLKNILRGNFLRDVKFRSISLKSVYNIVQQSFSVLDIADVNQSGYTYRAIDAMAAGKKLVTTNKFVKNERFYNENNILVIDRNNPHINPDFFETPFDPVDIDNYSLNNWIKKVFVSTES